MTYLFSKKPLQTLQTWLREERVLLGFDFDGTLAPLVKNPAKGTLPRLTRQLLIETAEHYRCAVISGRGREDVAARLPKEAKLLVIGNHGMEWKPSLKESNAFQKKIKTWANYLRSALEGTTHLLIEQKTYSITLHYRSDESRRKAEHAVSTGIQGARWIGGKNVINLVPKGALNKGTAFRKLQEQLDFSHGLFVGDDVTDQDVFALKPKSNLFTIQIGQPGWSTAKYYLDRQSEINRLLRLLIAVKKKA